MNDDEWNDFIRQTKERVVANPVEFLGEDLPETSLMKDILNDIFDEFLKEKAFLERSIQRLRA